MANKPSVEPQRDLQKSLADPIQIKNRIIKHAAFELADIAASKSWKLTAFYRQLSAIFFKGRLNFFLRVSNAAYITGKSLGFSREDIFNPRQLQPALPPQMQQLKLFGEPIRRTGEIAVILHLYYPDLWDEIVSNLCHVPQPFDLFISVPQAKQKIIPLLLQRYPQAHIYCCPNRGRDVAPFIEIYSAIIETGFSLICKIHSKKSNHLPDGDRWRSLLLSELLGSQLRVKAILDLFERHSEVGMLVSQNYLYSAVDISTMINLVNLERLSEVLDIPQHNFEFEYPAGSMFWCRAGSFRKLAQSGIRTADFPPEHGQLNGTLAHAVERFWGLMVVDNQQYIVDTSIL